MRIPITAVREFGKKHKLRQLVIYGWDGKQEHIATWGQDTEDCSYAASFGNHLKRRLGWPTKLRQQPARIRAIMKRKKLLQQENKALREKLKSYEGTYALLGVQKK